MLACVPGNKSRPYLYVLAEHRSSRTIDSVYFVYMFVDTFGVTLFPGRLPLPWVARNTKKI